MSDEDALSNVALRPWPAPAKQARSKEDLGAQVDQLAAERKQFLRDITEQALLDDIAAGRDGIADKQDKEEEAPTQLEMQQKLQKARAEVHSKLEWASFAAGNALNLVSLILSRDVSKYPNGKEPQNFYTSIFQQMDVPRGSFGLVKEPPAQPPTRPEDKAREEYTQRRKVLVMKGSRMDALDWATDSLLQAAKDLESNIDKETRYWDEILSISDKGWPLQRTQRARGHAPFAVRFGPPEASNRFKARGVAALQMDKDGGIILDPTLTSEPKTLRVRISEDDTITGTSHATIHDTLDRLAIERSIQLARGSLFEEELFYEMSVESRQLLSYGVELRGSVIHVTMPGEQSVHRKLLIDCIAQDDSALPNLNGAQDWFAQDIVEGLRVLLAHEHRMRLYRRTRLPPPLTRHKREQPTPPLLRTLLGIFSHLNSVDSLYAYMGAIAKTLKSAGLDVTLEASREISWAELTSTIKEAEKEDLTATDQLLATFIRPFEGKASLSLPSSSGASPDRITVATRSYIGPPHFGTEHKVALPPSLVKLLNLEHDPQRQLKFSSTEEVKSYLDWIVSLDISQTLLFREYAGRSVIKSSDPCIAVVSKGSKKHFIKEDSVEVQLEKATLKVEATAAANSQLATGSTVESYIWDGSPGQPSLKETVKRWFG